MNTYKTARGYTVTFQGIGTLLDQLNASRTLPIAPTRDVKTAFGAVEKVPLDQQSMKEHPENYTPEEQAAMQAYLDASDVEEREFNRRSVRMALLRGIMVEYPSDDNWVAEHIALGLKVPDDPTERKFHWVWTEVVGTPEDLLVILDGVKRASGVTEEAIANAEATFRRSVEGNPAQPIDTSPQQLDGEQAISGVQDRVQGGVAPKSVRRSKRNR